MFEQLPESRRIASRRRASGVVSAVVHAAAVGALVVVTARAEAPPIDDPVEHTLVYTHQPPPPAPPPTTVAPGVATSRPTVATAPDVIIPTIDAVPIAIPPVDLTRPLTSDDAWLRRGPGGAGLDGGTSGTGIVAGVGSGDVLSARQVDRAVMMAAGSPSPRYPDGLRAAGIEGEVVAEFVVDTAGRVEPGSVRIVRSAHAHFEQAVREALPRLVFMPAEYAGQKVRQLVQLPFRFAVERRDRDAASSVTARTASQGAIVPDDRVRAESRMLTSD